MRGQPEAPQTVPSVDAHTRQPPTHTAPEDDGATALRDRRIAKYEARLQSSWVRASAAYDAGCRDPDPVATTGAGLLRGAGHGYLLHPEQVIRPSRLAADTMDGPWAHHQQRVHRLTSSQPRPASATQYGAHKRVVESIGARMARQPAPPPVSLGPMEMPDSPSAEEDSDEGFVGYPPLPRGIKPQPLLHRYMEPNRGGERLS